MRNLLERMVLLAEQPVLSAFEVGAILATDAAGAKLSPEKELDAPAQMAAARDGPSSVRHYRQTHPGDAVAMAAALKATGGNKSRAAQRMGLTLRQFNYRLARLRMHEAGNGE